MRTKKGIVTSAKMNRTVAVEVTRHKVHPIYRKRYPVTKTFLADTGELPVSEGDAVLIGETRPISRRKHFRVLRILKGGEVKGVSLEEELREVSEDADIADGAGGRPTGASPETPERTSEQPLAAGLLALRSLQGEEGSPRSIPSKPINAALIPH